VPRCGRIRASQWLFGFSLALSTAPVLLRTMRWASVSPPSHIVSRMAVEEATGMSMARAVILNSRGLRVSCTILFLLFAPAFAISLIWESAAVQKAAPVQGGACIVLESRWRNPRSKCGPARKALRGWISEFGSSWKSPCRAVARLRWTEQLRASSPSRTKRGIDHGFIAPYSVTRGADAHRAPVAWTRRFAAHRTAAV